MSYPISPEPDIKYPEDIVSQEEEVEESRGCEFCEMGLDADGEEEHWFQNDKPMCPKVIETMKADAADLANKDHD